MHVFVRGRPHGAPDRRLDPSGRGGHGAAAAAVAAGDPRELYLTLSVRIGLLTKDRAEVRLSEAPDGTPAARGHTRLYWPRFRSVSRAPATVYGRLEPGTVLVVLAESHGAIVRASSAGE